MHYVFLFFIFYLCGKVSCRPGCQNKALELAPQLGYIKYKIWLCTKVLVGRSSTTKAVKVTTGKILIEFKWHQ